MIGASFDWAEAQPWLAAAVPACAAAFPTRRQPPEELPAPAYWAMAYVGEHTKYEAPCRAERELGITYTPVEDSIRATAASLLKLGHYSPPPPEAPPEAAAGASEVVVDAPDEDAEAEWCHVSPK